MNSKERLIRAVTFQPVDRVPVIPLLLTQGSKLLNIDLPSYQKSGRNIAKGQLKLLERLEHDAVIGIPHIVQDLTPWGSPLTYYKNGSPTLSKIVIRKAEEIKEIKVPDPANSMETRETLIAINILAKEVGHHTPVIGGLIAPFSLPSMLMGTGPFMEILINEDKNGDKYLKLLLDKCKQFVVAWAKKMVDQGADMIVMADGIASQTVISRRLFEKYVLPLLKETIKEIPVPVVYEAVGSAQGILDLIATTGAVLAILDYSDHLGECKKIAKGKIAIMGNFNNIEMLYWNRIRTLLEVKKAINKAADGYGYVLSSQGPEIPFNVPLEVIETMVHATKEFGNYHYIKNFNNI
ncbi:uroporphyrinogen decarboxylase family protein [Calidifontibacillus erzurumensis]|uniref:Uroporphyrinogen decarboxylase family protein n=1 Tax=Calidifontibacillus erzurumensis TaxID=2741433 RepID=A0A8J8GC44_9BACI|nr:uroporphyrinogen decarboxylase family protein [Calidifontibacillus erzurumensis]NSL50957.1 uroporphyrinogen decarboxylase family protein [Calidifontibacillus erzurumensis]